MITIQELLENRGITDSSKVKLVRHKDQNRDLYGDYLNKKSEFLKYQSEQPKPVFHNCTHIVAFIGEEGRLARFIDVYEVCSFKQLEDDFYVYDLQEAEGFDDLKERVIIDWGTSGQSWHQWFSNSKEVVEIQPGLHYQRFTDYFSFILDFKQLTEIVSNTYADWKKMLSATKGIYLIQDSSSGKLYVGSASGENGIWGRWESYVKSNGTGGNKQLDELIKLDQGYARNFKFSILMLLPKTTTTPRAVEMETIFKRKLGSNTFGLNCN